MPQHIGIVACSAEGAALCYRTICTEGPRLLGPHAHPEVTLHTPSLAEYVRCLDRDDWQGVGELMLASARKLADAGADFLICPDNTIHRALPLIERQSPLPWLHIAGVVAAEAASRGFRRLGLTGTRWLVDSEVYPEKLAARGLAFERPSPADRDECNRIIMDELVYGVTKPEGVAFFQSVIARLEDAGCDAVILGCTEIPLIIDDSNSALPTLDSTRLLARSALRRAAGWSVRDAEASEFDALVHLWRSGWADAHLSILPPALVRLRTLEDFTTRMRKMYDSLRVVGPPGEPLGFHAVKNDELDQLYVSAQARGTGAAVALLHDAESRLAARGTRTAWLACAIGNERAAHFYEKHGWRRTGTVSYRPDTPEGPFPLEVWRFEKRLSSPA
jgi:aspartate racemase